MSFPSPSEYDDAIQNLSSAFIDEELKCGRNDGPMRFGVHGTVASGSFAIVYRIRCGTKRYAVKCFTSQPPADQQIRYEQIHDHLSRSRLKCSVDFHYLKEGVRVSGRTYPILKMEWMDAPTLLKHLPAHLGDQARLARLSDAFLSLSGDLRNNRIAHGDLQHGNLLVSGDNLKIIDYDGMCVPGTNGFRSVENGLPPYQHPRRNGGKLSPSLDHFSLLVIWISVYALSLDPNLWIQHIGDAERLLFMPSDFSSPHASQIFKKLRSYKDARLTKAVSSLYEACFVSDLELIPNILDVLADRTVWWKSDRPTRSRKTAPLPDWIAPDPAPPLPRLGSGVLLDPANARPETTPLRTPPETAPTQPGRVPWWKRIFTKGAPATTPTQLVAPPVKKPAPTVIQPASPASPKPVASISRPVTPPVQKAAAPARSPARSTALGRVAGLVLPTTAPFVGKLIATSRNPSVVRCVEPVVGDLRKVVIGGGTELALCGIPAGTFPMGGLRGGGPRHVVTLTRGFWMGRTPVTQDQWQEVMGNNPSQFKGKDRPVENVCWNEAKEFCVKLNAMLILPSGWKWSLPTEAQWEYACWSGGANKYITNWYGRNQTDSVAMMEPNAWGIYDMVGNVWELCIDSYLPGKSDAVTDPVGSIDGNWVGAKGGSWIDSGCQISERNNYNASRKTNYLGFRVATIQA